MYIPPEAVSRHRCRSNILFLGRGNVPRRSIRRVQSSYPITKRATAANDIDFFLLYEPKRSYTGESCEQEEVRDIYQIL